MPPTEKPTFPFVVFTDPLGCGDDEFFHSLR